MIAARYRPANLDRHAKFFRGLSDPARLSLLMQLTSGSRTAGEMARACSLSPSNASNHLRCLLECGLIDVEPEGRHNVYRLRTRPIARLLEASARIVHSAAGSLIESCPNYQLVSRRALRASAEAPAREEPRPQRARSSRTRKVARRRVGEAEPLRRESLT